jgi:hypothetical protein
MDVDSNDSFHWAFGKGFWYADPLAEVKDLSEERLYWSPTPDTQCVLCNGWAHRFAYRKNSALAALDDK